MEVGGAEGEKLKTIHQLIRNRASCITIEANLGARSSFAAGPSNGDQTETGGVCKEGKSPQDQGTSFPSKLACCPRARLSNPVIC